MKNYPPSFWLLSLSSFLFFGSFNMVLPELPNFMRSIGGEEYIGLHITFFTITALISRPFSGKLTDKWGRIPVMMIGTLVTVIVSLFYPFILNIYGFFFIRFLHGFSTGFKPTGTTAYVSDISPKEKRGESLGLFSFFGMIGMGLGNFIGGEIAEQYSVNVLFFASSGVSLLSVLILLGLKETLENRQKFSFELLKIKKDEIYEPTVKPPFIVMILVTYLFGLTLTLAPDFSTFLGIKNKGLFMLYFTMSSLVARVTGGKLSDIYGRERVLTVAMFVVTIGSICIGFSTSTTQFFIGALILGAGYGLSSPSIFAWAADLADEKHRGRAFSTVYMALEIGIGFGAFISGQLYAGKSENLPLNFSIGAGMSFIAFLYLVFRKKS